jgi:hypothetical protein
MGRAALVLLAALSLAACREEAEGGLNADSVDFPWPFTVESGSVECREGLQVVFVTGGTAYPLNEAAARDASAQGYAPLADIWAADPAASGARIPIAPVLQLGLAEC